MAIHQFQPTISGPNAPSSTPETPSATLETTVTPGVTQDTTAPSRPEWLPQEFKTEADFVKSHKELRADYTRKTQELANLKKVTVIDSNGKPIPVSEPEADPKAAEEAEKPSETPKADETTQVEDKSADEAAKALESKGLNMAEFSQEFKTQGELSADSLAKLEAVGISKEFADRYIEGQKAIADRIVTDLLTPHGGAEGFQKMAVWAKANMSPEAVKAFDNTMTSGDVELCKIALDGLSAKYTSALGGTEPNLVAGPSSKGNAGDVFLSNQQITTAMSDPRYKTDPAYRKAVTEKLARS